MLAQSLTTCASDGFGGGFALHASPQKIRLTTALRSFFPFPSLTVVVLGASPALLNFCTTRSAPPGAAAAFTVLARPNSCGTTPLPLLNCHFSFVACPVPFVFK